MKNRKLYIIIILMIVTLIIGCSSNVIDNPDTGIKIVETTTTKGKITTKPNSNNSKGSKTTSEKEKKDNEEKEDLTNTEITMSLINLFPKEVGKTMHYMGMVDYGRYDTVVKSYDKIGDVTERHIVIEGEIEDLSDGEAGDLSYVNHYRMTKEAVYQIYSEENETILLKNPIVEGNSWETIMFSKKSGYFPVKITITKVEDEIITTEMVLLNENNNNINKHHIIKSEVEYEIGKGITKEIETFSYTDESGLDNQYDFSKVQHEISNKPPENFVKRYVDIDSRIKEFYNKDYMFYDEIIGTGNQWARENKDINNKNEFVDKYKEIINSLAVDEIKSISTAAEVGNTFVKYADEKKILEIFEDFYHSCIISFESKFTDVFFLNDLFEYSNHDNKMNYKYIYNDEIRRIKTILLKENGIGIFVEEGYPVLMAYPGYIYSKFSNIEDSNIIDYLNIKDKHLKNKPLYVEGMYALTWSETVGMIVETEKYISEDPNGYGIDSETEVSYEHQGGTNMYMLYKTYTNAYIKPFYSYYSGKYDPFTLKASSEIIESYKYFIENYENAEIQPIIKEIYRLLEANNYYYGMELYTYINDIGYGPQDDDMYFYEEVFNRLKSIGERNEEIKELKSKGKFINIQQNSNTVVVSNANELLEAIKPGATILLESGEYIIPYNYSNQYVSTEYGALNIKDVDNVSIFSVSEDPVKILSDGYDYVMNLKNCNDLKLYNISLGHIQEYCKAGVLYLESCNSPEINGSILFGCGEWGIETKNCKSVIVRNTLISDCKMEAARLDNSINVSFNNCKITRNGVKIFDITACDSIKLRNCVIVENGYSDNSYNPENEMLYNIDNSTNISIDDSSNTHENNKATKLIEESK